MKAEEGFVEPIEGYLSSKKAFNGVLIVLREPNADEQDSFWLKDCFEKGPKDALSKRTFTKWNQTFDKLLSYCCNSKKPLQVKNCAFANIIPYRGNNQSSEEYRKLSEKYKEERIASLIEDCNPRYVFVCNDMFDAIKNVKKLDYTNDGVKYSKTQRRKIVLANGTIVFEIYHPSAPTSYPVTE